MRKQAIKDRKSFVKRKKVVDRTVVKNIEKEAGRIATEESQAKAEVGVEVGADEEAVETGFGSVLGRGMIGGIIGVARVVAIEAIETVEAEVGAGTRGEAGSINIIKDPDRTKEGC